MISEHKFKALLALTRIELGTPLWSALHAHLVTGLTQAEAADKFGYDRSNLKKRLDHVLAVKEKADEYAKTP